MNKELETISKIIFEDETRPYFQYPFSDGIHTYAANGFCVLRIKGQHCESIPEKYQKSLNLCIKIFTTFNFSKDRCTLTLKSDEIKEIIEKTREACPECKGSGRVFEQACYECDGSGEVEFENDHSHYEIECNTCSGKMVIKGNDPMVCPRCNGSGQEKIKGNLRISENSTLGLYMLNGVLDTLGEIKIAVDSKDIRHGVPFFNDDIEGIIMPVVNKNAPVPVRTFDLKTGKMSDPWD